MIGYTLMLLITLVVVIMGFIVVGATLWNWQKEKSSQDDV